MDKSERSAWAALLRDLRKEAGLKQEDLASAAGISRRTVGSIERGVTVPQADVLHRLLDALGVEPEARTVPLDVKQFVAMVTPLLRRLTPEKRAELIPQLITLVVEAFPRGADVVRPDFGVQAADTLTMDSGGHLSRVAHEVNVDAEAEALEMEEHP